MLFLNPFVKSNLWFLSATIIVAYVVADSPCHGQTMKAIETSLQKRENSLSGLKYEWSISQTLTRPGIDFSKNPLTLKHIFQQVKQNALNKGASDAAAQASAQAIVQNLVSTETPFTAQMNQSWLFINDGTKTVVAGENQSSKSYRGRYVAYYFDNYGLEGNPSGTNLSTGVKSNMHTTVEVWSTPGDATRYRNAFATNDLFIYPEDFCLLIGKNPLAMYGGGWRFVRSAGNATIIQREVAEGSDSPFGVEVALDKKHDNIPVEIHVTRNQGAGVKWTAEYHVTKFIRQGDQWISSEVETSYSIPEQMSYHRLWQLSSVTKALPVTLTMHDLQDVADYRLLGPNLTVPDEAAAWRNNPHDIVKYQWTAVNKKLPDYNELQTLHNKLNPGEATNEDGQLVSASPGLITPASRSRLINLLLPFLGSALLIIGGVWMFKQRKAN